MGKPVIRPRLPNKAKVDPAKAEAFIAGVGSDAPKNERTALSKTLTKES